VSRTVISVQDLHKSYGTTEVLRGVSFDVHPNELFALLGPNGAGKTTLLHILCTILRPDEGTARINGVDVVRNPRKARRDLGVVFQEPSLDDRLTLYENLIETLLDKAKLRIGPSGTPRSIYCFRHTYATLRLAEGVDAYLLAEQMGTSVKMIQDHYGHVNTIKHADLVLNGIELGSGSIRIHQQEIQSQIFSALGMSKEEASSRFGFFLEALEYGTPPHGGIALGLDRIVMILAGADSLREVIPFPKTARAVDLMVDAPTQVSEQQLKELGLVVKPTKS